MAVQSLSVHHSGLPYTTDTIEYRWPAEPYTNQTIAENWDAVPCHAPTLAHSIPDPDQPVVYWCFLSVNLIVYVTTVVWQQDEWKNSVDLFGLCTVWGTCKIVWYGNIQLDPSGVSSEKWSERTPRLISFLHWNCNKIIVFSNEKTTSYICSIYCRTQRDCS